MKSVNITAKSTLVIWKQNFGPERDPEQTGTRNEKHKQPQSAVEIGKTF